MTLATTVERIAELQALADPNAAARAAAVEAARTARTSRLEASTSAVQAVPNGAFATALRSAAQSTASGASPMIAAAQSQTGVVEQPPGSNDGPEIAAYRQAVAGNPGPGPWCAYFVSWAAKQAGTPLGDAGQGFGSVDEMWSWAQSSGRGIANGPGVVPQVGDVIVLNQHTGIVTGVLPDGRVQTIEGNTTDSVAAREHPAGEAIGYIRLP